MPVRLAQHTTIALFCGSTGTLDAYLIHSMLLPSIIFDTQVASLQRHEFSRIVSSSWSN
jgi:hypothetical protein